MDPIEKELQRRLQKKGGKCQAFTLATLKQATSNFGKKLGVGGFGEVFYGKLPDGQEVAVKTLSASSHQSKQEFFNEVSSYTTNFD
jgi:RIO-like serine/threonine protein kinase